MITLLPYVVMGAAGAFGGLVMNWGWRKVAKKFDHQEEKIAALQLSVAQLEGTNTPNKEM